MAVEIVSRIVLCDGLLISCATCWVGKRATVNVPRPRIHDLRHTFACRRLLSWYRQGKNVHNLIAALSTYMGHGKVTDTYWYLTGTPELLAIAGGRFERFARAEKGGRA